MVFFFALFTLCSSFIPYRVERSSSKTTFLLFGFQPPRIYLERLERAQYVRKAFHAVSSHILPFSYILLAFPHLLTYSVIISGRALTRSIPTTLAEKGAFPGALWRSCLHVQR